MRKSLGLFSGSWPRAVVWGVLGGGIFLVLLSRIAPINIAISVDRLGIALATAVVEELVFAGVILTILFRETKREGVALGITGLAFALIHLPVNIFVFRLEPSVLVGAFCLAFFVSLINGFLKLRSDNVLSAILAHFVFLVLVLG